MSLIPSESYSFPDHFTITKAASRKPTNVEPEAPVARQRKNPSIVALPNPRPQLAPQPERPRQHEPAPVAAKHNPERAHKIAPPIPNPALRRANASPPRISEPPVRKMALPATLKPKVRWNNRAPVINQSAPSIENSGPEEFDSQPAPGTSAPNVIQMHPPPPAPQVLPRPVKAFSENAGPALQRPEIRSQNSQPHNPFPVAPTKPVARAAAPNQRATRSVHPAAAPRMAAPAPAPAPQTDFFQMFAESNETAISKRRRKAKMRRFLVCESVAVGVLLPLAILGLAHRPENVALLWIMNVFTIAAAVASALIPILFFAATPTLPEIER